MTQPLLWGGIQSHTRAIWQPIIRLLVFLYTVLHLPFGYLATYYSFTRTLIDCVVSTLWLPICRRGQFHTRMFVRGT